MSLGNPNPGAGSVSEYQVSAVPWVTSSNINGVVQFSFPFVTSFYTLKNVTTLQTGSINVGYTYSGTVGTNYYTLSGSESFSGNLRVKTLFISGSGQFITLHAGLTTIPASNFPTLSASNSTPGVG